MRAIVTIALILSGCTLPDTSYILDGVPVVCEQAEGPGPDAMAHVADIWRTGARDRWGLSDEQETAVWRRLEQIRWVQDPIHTGVRYVPEVPIIRANWEGCVLAVFFFRPLLQHYTEEPTADDWAWVAELHNSHASRVCDNVKRTVRLSW